MPVKKNCPREKKSERPVCAVVEMQASAIIGGINATVY
jgi:hypothetical protein